MALANARPYTSPFVCGAMEEHIILGVADPFPLMQ